VAAVFDVSDPYNMVAVDPVVFPGTDRIEGITFLRSPAGEPTGLIASSEGNDKVSITTSAPLAEGSAFKLQLFHLADQEGNISALDDAPRLSGVLNALRAQDIDLDGIPGFTNTLTLSSGDAWIPGLFYGSCTTADLYLAYRAHCSMTGETAESLTAFGKRLSRRFGDRKRREHINGIGHVAVVMPENAIRFDQVQSFREAANEYAANAKRAKL
jgi:hypothetical protein